MAGVKGSVYPVSIIFYTKPLTTVDVTSVGYATFYDSTTAYEIPDGLTASYVESCNGKSLNLVECVGIIPAGCGVILEGAEKTYKLYVSEETPVNPENLLRGTDEEEKIADDPNYKFYALSNGSKGVGFYFMVDGGAAFTNAAHKAYLAVEKDGTTEANFIGLFDTDGIDQMVVRKADADAPAYNLAGQRVSDNYRGVVIVNGVKSIRK